MTNNQHKAMSLAMAAALVMMSGGSAFVGPVVAADNVNASTSSATQPVFLLSERNLGTGFKICFLSNGLQMRMPSTQLCPYPLQAPPLADEKPLSASPLPAPAPASFSPNPIKAETVTEPTKLPQPHA